jgi:probable HAF family extracellular repeat protein
MPSISMLRFAVIGSSMALAAAACANSYTIIDLGKQNLALGVNHDGVVVGSTGMTDKAIEYRAGKWHYLAISQQEGSAVAINAHGDAVGVNGNAATLWERFGVRKTLPLPAAASFSVAQGIGEDRLTVGYYLPVNDSAHYRCFQTSPGGTARDLGMRAHGDTCYATAINVHGQIVGEANAKPGALGRAFVWQVGAFRSLGVLPGGDYSVAIAINEPGQVVGASATAAGAGHVHAFLWSAGTMRDIGLSYSFTSSQAYAINDGGEIVGVATDAAKGKWHAVRFAGGAVIPLDSEVADRGDWRLTYANGINGAGKIVGQGQRSDGPHGFMLVPLAR